MRLDHLGTFLFWKLFHFFPSLGSISISSLSARVTLNIQFSRFVGFWHCLLTWQCIWLLNTSWASLISPSHFELCALDHSHFFLGLGNCSLTIFTPLLFFLGAFFLLHTYSSMCSQEVTLLPTVSAELGQAGTSTFPVGPCRGVQACYSMFTSATNPLFCFLLK